MNAPARVLLLEVPTLLREILEHAIEQDEDYELAPGQNSNGGPPDGHEAERASPPDVVILGLTAAEDATLVPALFARWPNAQVLTVMQNGGDAVVYELSPSRQALGEISPAEILVVLRDSVQRKRELARESFTS
jgi:hypothetical protein